MESCLFSHDALFVNNTNSCTRIPDIDFVLVRHGGRL